MKDNIKDENARKDADDLATKISHSINDHTK